MQQTEKFDEVIEVLLRRDRSMRWQVRVYVDGFHRPQNADPSVDRRRIRGIGPASIVKDATGMQCPGVREVDQCVALVLAGAQVDEFHRVAP